MLVLLVSCDRVSRSFWRDANRREKRETELGLDLGRYFFLDTGMKLKKSRPRNVLFRL